jgi:hypothetical protein
MSTYRLLIAIEHTLPNSPLVDFRKEPTIKATTPNRMTNAISPLKIRSIRVIISGNNIFS